MRHPGDTQETQEAPRRHPGGTQEAPRRPENATGVLEAKCAKFIVFFSAKVSVRPLSRRRERRELRCYCACAQKLADVGVKIAGQPKPNTEDTPPEPLHQRLFGE